MMILNRGERCLCWGPTGRDGGEKGVARRVESVPNALLIRRVLKARPVLEGGQRGTRTSNFMERRGRSMVIELTGT